MADRIGAEKVATGHYAVVREGRLYFMDKNLYNLKPNHRWGESYEILADILYGESET